MKKLKILIFILCISGLLPTLLIAQQYHYGSTLKTKLSTAQKEHKVTHINDIWQLAEFDGNDKLDILLEAVEYHQLGENEKLRGIKLTVLDEGGAGENTAKKITEYVSYIDEVEFAEITVVLSDMIADLAKRETSEQFGSMTYISTGGIVIGFTKSKNKKVGQLGIAFENGTITADFSNIEKMLTEFKEQLDSVSKQLYLPANAEKQKKVKKSKQEATDIIVDDI